MRLSVPEDDARGLTLEERKELRQQWHCKGTPPYKWIRYRTCYVLYQCGHSDQKAQIYGPPGAYRCGIFSRKTVLDYFEKPTFHDAKIACEESVRTLCD